MRRLFEMLFPPRSESAAIARERLKIVLAHERVSRDGPDFLPALQQELLDVVSRYIEIRPDMLRINLDKSGETSLLEINVEIDGAKAKSATPDIAEAKSAIVAALEPAKSG
ncbi:MAG TPA: cell division topological specificity factor MinE [Stellaceae bacterium]|nr:cell division topological specificity factor MinE [Stellaceae bacterium]